MTLILCFFEPGNELGHETSGFWSCLLLLTAEALCALGWC